jgi:hypothetical protein
VVIDINHQTNIFGLVADLEEHVVTPLHHLQAPIAMLIDEGTHAFQYAHGI